MVSEPAMSVEAAERELAEKAAGNGTAAKESAAKMAGVPKGADSKPAKPKGLLPFTVITICYLLFTVTDGAMRMIVLMHAYTAGFSAMQVAIMFTLYELAGVVTNLAAGLAGARWGIKCTLLTGLVLQLVSYGLLFGWQEDWPQAEAIIYVTVAQMFGGIARTSRSSVARRSQSS